MLQFDIFELKSWQFLGEIKAGKFEKYQSTNQCPHFERHIQKVSKIRPAEF